ncbi:hypothetical protein MP228_009026 [Amoeboaphelidium protococcarum]|nr:hypothetical protein MP228_009026 [Amoeboaphelidium protococcarum]
MRLITFFCVVLLLIALCTMAMPPKKKAASKQKKFNKKGGGSSNSNLEQREVFRYMVDDNPLLATYNPDYIDDLVLQKRVLDAYQYTHEYLISTLNFVKPLIKHRNEYFHYVTAGELARNRDQQDPEFRYAMQQTILSALSESIMQYPWQLLTISFFDNALEALLDGRLSKGHIYNVVSNLVVALSQAMSVINSDRQQLTTVTQMCSPALYALKHSGMLAQTQEVQSAMAYCRVGEISTEPMARLQNILNNLNLFDSNMMHQSIRQALAALRGDGTKNPELATIFTTLGEPFIGYLQLYQILFPVVAENKRYVTQLRQTFTDIQSSKKKFSKSLHSVLYQSKRRGNHVQQQSQIAPQFAYDRFINEFKQRTNYREHLNSMLEVFFISGDLVKIPIAASVEKGYMIFSSYCLIALPLIDKTVQSHRLRESHIPHEYAPLQLDSPSTSSFPLPYREVGDAFQDPDNDDTIIDGLNAMDLTQNEGGDEDFVSQAEKSLVKLDVPVDPEYKKDVDFNVESNDDEAYMWQQGTEEEQSDVSSVEQSKYQLVTFPFANNRKEICRNWRISNRYTFALSDELLLEKPVIFSANQLLTLCQITDGATQGGFNVKYDLFLRLLAEFNADVIPLTGSISRIIVPMQLTHPVCIHGPHSGSVQLGRRVINGARRVLDYYQILPENFIPVD